jgi:hypothetical protein
LYRYLFDKDNAASLISALAYASNNATLLREEIKSETFAHIQLSICHMECCAENRSDIHFLQMLTDNLLAFWGAVDERMYKRDARNMVKIGKYVETFDLHIRFDYPHERILYCLDRLERHIIKEDAIFDLNLFFSLKQETELGNYDKTSVLNKLGRLFVV